MGVLSVSLSDVVKPRLGIQGQTQGAGTPNQAGIGGFLPLVVGENSGRTVGELFLAGPRITRRNVQREMVASGHAVVMPQYAKPCPWAR